MFCSKCGSQVNEGAGYCSRCGANVAPAVDQRAGDVSPKSRLATSLLAIFLGWSGAHRFYTGKIVTAVVMLLLGIGSMILMLGVGFVGAMYNLDDPESLLFWLCYHLSLACGFAVGIWSLVDFIMAVSGNVKDKQGRPIKKW